MKIFLKYVSVLKISGVKNESWVELKSKSTVSDLLEFLEIPENHQQYIIPYVNDEARNRVVKFLNEVLNTDEHPLTCLDRPIESETAKIVENLDHYRKVLLNSTR